MIVGVYTVFCPDLAGLPPGVFLIAFLKNLQDAPLLARIALTVAIEVQKILFIPVALTRLSVKQACRPDVPRFPQAPVAASCIWCAYAFFLASAFSRKRALLTATRLWVARPMSPASSKASMVKS